MQGIQTAPQAAPQAATSALADSQVRSETAAKAVRWYLPELIFVSGIGIFTIALADVLSRASISWAALPLWIGLLLIFRRFQSGWLQSRRRATNELGCWCCSGGCCMSSR